MLVFSWAINFEVNWRALNSKDSWGHWQHVWLIMTHESTLTLVIAGIVSSPPLPSSSSYFFCFFMQPRLQGLFFPSGRLHFLYLFQSILLFFIFSFNIAVIFFSFFFLRNSMVSWVSALHKSLPLFSHLLSLKVYGVPSSM